MIQDAQRFKGRTALLSGGLGDIGRAIALAFARAGAAVALGDLREPAAAESFLTELRAFGVRARYDQADVADGAAVERWVGAVEADLGLPDLIIPNAAIVTFKPFTEFTPAEWSRELRVNLDGAFFLAQAAARRLLRQHRPGRIVFVGSWAAERPHVHIPAYCAAKAGLRQLMRCLALDLAGAGILVNEVAPGYVDAGLSGQVFSRHPERREASRAHVPVKALIEPREVADQVLYLCDSENRHLTGITLTMDGGLSLRIGG